MLHFKTNIFSVPGENEHLGEFESKSAKYRDAAECLLENSHKLCHGFLHAMKARRTCFISFIKLYVVRNAYELKTHLTCFYEKSILLYQIVLTWEISKVIFKTTFSCQKLKVFSHPGWMPNTYHWLNSIFKLGALCYQGRNSKPIR